MFEVGFLLGLVDDESPFTDISQQGPKALFSASKVSTMVQVLDKVRRMAVGWGATDSANRVTNPQKMVGRE